MKGLSKISKVTLVSSFGIVVYGITMFVILTGFYKPGNINWISHTLYSTYADFADIEDSESAEIQLTPVSNSNNVQNVEINLEDHVEEIEAEIEEIPKVYVDPSVFSSLNLRYDGRIHRIKSSEIQMMMGNNEYVEDAKASFNSFGEVGVRTIVAEIFEPYHYDKKIFQPNEDGISQGSISGFDYYESDYGPDIDDTVSEVIRVVNLRLQLNQGNQDYISVKNITHEGTNGEYSKGKYIELDQSKQVIWAWEDGKLYKKWDASGFYDEYAVYGVFDVINKSENAWSPIAEKWMPYWMAFYYEEKQAAWFGLHELVYWYDADGNYIEESSDSIGFKKSGGCVRLDRGKMIELYDWTDVGIHFLIYE